MQSCFLYFSVQNAWCWRDHPQQTTWSWERHEIFACEWELFLSPFVIYLFSMKARTKKRCSWRSQMIAFFLELAVLKAKPSGKRNCDFLLNQGGSRVDSKIDIPVFCAPALWDSHKVVRSKWGLSEFKVRMMNWVINKRIVSASRSLNNDDTGRT